MKRRRIGRETTQKETMAFSSQKNLLYTVQKEKKSLLYT